MRCRGLTLLELIVVLTILVALGTVMITQSVGLTDEARYKQTERTLEQLRDAVIGRQPYAGEDPTAVPAGFVADMGRLPQIGSAKNLAELYDLSEAGSGLPAFSLQTLGATTSPVTTGFDNDLSLSCGWRGPYIRRPIGSSEFLDGWGKPFTLVDTAGIDIPTGSAATVEKIGGVASAGSPAGDVFNVPLGVTFQDTSDPIPANHILEATGDLTVELTFDFPATAAATDSFHIVVRVYGPINGQAGIVGQSLGDGSADAWTFTYNGSPRATQVFPPFRLPVGPKLVRVYQLANDTAPGTVRNVASSDLSGTPNLFSDTSKSDAVVTTVSRRGSGVLKLTLRGEK